VFGCDGVHSDVRKLWFGNEAEFSHFLGAYGSVITVDELLIPENTSQMHNEPGKLVLLSAYNDKADIILVFSSEPEIPYDYRDEEQKRNILMSRFSGVGWRTQELLKEVKRSENLYFDKLSQIKTPSWTKGRVALVGDAGYCASPAAGMGGSLAIDGAAAMGDAFRKWDGSFEPAFQEYNESFRPFIEECQANAVRFVEFLVPKTAEAIRARNAQAQSA
jgi:2-polyprenyl-6-methoxyphenol hydroxylase-like FAD-dependent oxidoreductase